MHQKVSKRKPPFSPLAFQNCSLGLDNIRIYLNTYLTSAYCRLILVDQDWVPRAPNSSLYIRPTMIGKVIIIFIISIIIIIMTS